MKRIVVLLFLVQLSVAMLIPEDTEILDGFVPEFIPELSPEDDYFEARSMSSGSLFNSVRNKRAAIHHTEESNGLISHFRPNTVNAYSHNAEEVINESTPTDGKSIGNLIRSLKNGFTGEESSGGVENADNEDNISIANRHRRSTNSEKKPQKEVNNEKPSESLPIAMKLTKSSNDYASSRDLPSAAPLTGKFVRSPFEYSKVQHEEDSIAMDSSSMNMNEGMKSRTPRVNFVTQQKKSLEHDDTKSASATKSDFYKTPPLLHNSKESPATSSSERHPERSSTARPADTYSTYKDRDVNSNRYDDRYIEDMYPPPPDVYDPMYESNGPYDPYMRRPYNDYNAAYSGGRLDIPDYRDYPPPYGNELDNRYYMRSDMMPPALTQSSTLPRKRIVYYAYLPEVVRSPPTVDFRYRSYDRYDPYYYDSYNYEANMMRNAYRRPMPDRHSIVDKASMLHENRAARPMKLYNDEMSRNSSSKSDKFYNDNRATSTMHANPYRKSYEYDPYLY